MIHYCNPGNINNNKNKHTHKILSQSEMLQLKEVSIQSLVIFTPGSPTMSLAMEGWTWGTNRRVHVSDSICKQVPTSQDY